MNLRKNLDVFIPLIFSLIISIPLGLTVWTAFFWIGPWVGGSMSLGSAISKRKGPEALDLGRRLSLILLLPLFLVFFGFMQRENFQIEETVFYSAYFPYSFQNLRKCWRVSVRLPGWILNRKSKLLAARRRGM